MGLSQFPAPTLTAIATTYGASASPVHSVAASTSYVSAASVTFTTTTPNTNWLFEVDADVNWASGFSNIPGGYRLGARVDGGDYGTTGSLGFNPLSSAGVEIIQFGTRGRFVLTLASSGSHTAAASLYNLAGSNPVTVNAITITVTQLAG